MDALTIQKRPQAPVNRPGHFRADDFVWPVCCSLASLVLIDRSRELPDCDGAA